MEASILLVLVLAVLLSKSLLNSNPSPLRTPTEASSNPIPAPNRGLLARSTTVMFWNPADFRQAAVAKPPMDPPIITMRVFEMEEFLGGGTDRVGIAANVLCVVGAMMERCVSRGLWIVQYSVCKKGNKKSDEWQQKMMAHITWRSFSDFICGGSSYT